MSPKNISEDEFLGVGNLKITAPCYKFDNYKIWGATAMIMSELNDVLKGV